MARIVPCQLIGAEGQRGRLKAVAGTVLPGQGGGQITLRHAHGGIGAAAPPRRADAEHAADILGRGLIHLAEHLVDGQHQVLTDAHNKLLVAAFLQLVVEDVQRVFDKLFVHRGQHTAAIDAAAGGGVSLGQFLD